MENPNEYSDQTWADGNNAVTRAVHEFWLAGANAEEVAEAIKNGFEEVDVSADVDIELAPLAPSPHVGGGSKRPKK
jgi:hypothetical protein